VLKQQGEPESRIGRLDTAAATPPAEASSVSGATPKRPLFSHPNSFVLCVCVLENRLQLVIFLSSMHYCEPLPVVHHQAASS
jgi:hypothetical protein